MLQNAQSLPASLKGDNLIKMFDDINAKFEAKSFPEKIGAPGEFQFLNEMPPKTTEVTSKLLEIIDKAVDNIKIIQPYVQNIEEVEQALFDAMNKRGVKVEIITARNRDQPIYKTFLNSDLFREFLKQDCKVYEEPFKYLHMKAVSVDNGKYLTIGSLNQDHCSFY